MSVQQIKIRRGTDAQRQGVTLAEGEPAFTTDTKQLFVGDGVTPGGVPIAGIAETTLGPHGVDLFAQVRQADGSALTTNTSQTNAFHIKAGANGAFVLAGPALTSGNYATTGGVFQFVLPPHFVAGGQVRGPLYGALITLSDFDKKYEAGAYQVGQTVLYVSRGIGFEPSAPRVRFNCRPEIAVIDLIGV